MGMSNQKMGGPAFTCATIVQASGGGYGETTSATNLHTMYTKVDLPIMQGVLFENADTSHAVPGAAQRHRYMGRGRLRVFVYLR